MSLDEGCLCFTVKLIMFWKRGAGCTGNSEKALEIS